jgi:hypothetical protein
MEMITKINSGIEGAGGVENKVQLQQFNEILF